MGPQINDPSDKASLHSKILGRQEEWKEPQTTIRPLCAETAVPREASIQETGLLLPPTWQDHGGKEPPSEV